MPRDSDEHFDPRARNDLVTLNNRAPASSRPWPGRTAVASVRTGNERHARRRDGQETAVFTSSTTFFSTVGLHFRSAYATGHRSPSSRLAASWKPKVEYR
jgi:hypothetical protein